MPDCDTILDRRPSLDRRQFTVNAALAILAGCVITITDSACGSSPAAPAAVVPPADVTGNVSANHGHIAVITGAQITAGGAIPLNIQGGATHPHTLTISQADLTSLKNKQPVTIASTTDNGHSHSVTFTPV
jgi:hypothetical protein